MHHCKLFCNIYPTIREDFPTNKQKSMHRAIFEVAKLVEDRRVSSMDIMIDPSCVLSGDRKHIIISRDEYNGLWFHPILAEAFETHDEDYRERVKLHNEMGKLIIDREDEYLIEVIRSTSYGIWHQFFAVVEVPEEDWAYSIVMSKHGEYVIDHFNNKAL
jgi:hypothetical protein